MPLKESDYEYECMQCDAGTMTRAKALAHLHYEGHEIAENVRDDVDDTPPGEDD
jgi:hypothetical protein